MDKNLQARMKDKWSSSTQFNPSRRRFLNASLLGLAGGLLGATDSRSVQAATANLLTKLIPSSQKPIPVIGLGSSRTFNVGDDPQALDNVAGVMHYFFNAGGRMIDSSPMYGSSQSAIGYGLRKLGMTSQVFSADKIWIDDADAGMAQMDRSRELWNVASFDLMQVHNLVAWEEHLKTLYQLKKAGKLRYVGITTSHGRRHDELAAIMKTEPLDFVQFSYNIIDREVEEVLLPLAAKRGIAVIVNRPFQRGELVDTLQGAPMPKWAGEIDCHSWPQFLLKFVVSHPAVTCAIPATTQVDHLMENMAAGLSPMPDAQMRALMINYVEKLI